MNFFLFSDRQVSILLLLIFIIIIIIIIPNVTVEWVAVLFRIQ
jgi:hypothetical protein